MSAPPPPPKSGSTSQISTPTATSHAQAQSQRPPPPPPELPTHAGELHGTSMTGGVMPSASVAQPQPIPDPGDQWLPRFLEDKSKQDLAEMLSSPTLLSALTHAPQTMHASLAASHAALRASLADNVALGQHLTDVEGEVLGRRAATQAALLSTHALERAWRAKQSAMDHALGGFAPARLYQRLAAGVAEQEGVCLALEESFLEGEGPGGEGGPASERETAEWVRRYRDAKKLYYLRWERKERWDEGRVGGWR